MFPIKLTLSLLLFTLAGQLVSCLPTSTLSASQLAAAVPGSTSCDPSAQFAGECRTAAQAAPAINKAFAKYGIASKGEKAALISLMAFETGAFKFQRNHFPAPGRPGQGTRNLMMFPFVFKFTQDTPSLKNKALAIVRDPNTATPDQQNKVLDLAIQSDDLSFSTAAWFLKTQCPQSISDGLKTGSMAAWEAYTTNCVGTTVTDDRRKAFTIALAAF